MAAPEEAPEPDPEEFVEAFDEEDEGAPFQWPDEPDLPGTIAPEPIPVDVLPHSLRRWAKSVAASVQVSPDLTAALALSCVSATAAGKYIIRPDDAWDREWPVLYTVGIAGPGERKSPAFRHMTEPLAAYEEARVREVSPKRRMAEETASVAESRLQSMRKAASKNDVSEEDLEKLEAAVLEAEEATQAIPVIPQLLASDATPEALVRIMAEQGGRVAVFSPEGGPLQILDGRYSDGAARLEELAQAYDGETIRTTRITRDTVVVPSPALTLCVMVQPSVLETVRNARSLRGQGILARIAWVLPPSMLGGRLDSSEVAPLDRRALKDYARTLERLLDWRPKDVDEDGTPVPHVLELSPEAAEVKRAYHYKVEEGLAPGGELEGIADWVAKLVGRAIRIAALLDLASRAEDNRPLVDPISGWAMKSAVRICRALTTHAMAVYGLVGRRGREDDLQYLLARLVELPEGIRESKFWDPHTRGRASIDDAEDHGRLVDELERRGCLRRVPEATAGVGRPKSLRLELHPKLRDRSPEELRRTSIRDFRDARVETGDPVSEVLGGGG